MLPLMLIPPVPLAVKLLKALIPPTAPPKTIEPLPALTVRARVVESLLMVLENVTIPELEVIVLSPVKVTAPFKLILPATPVPVLVKFAPREIALPVIEIGPAKVIALASVMLAVLVDLPMVRPVSVLGNVQMLFKLNSVLKLLPNGSIVSRPVDLA